MAGLKGKPEQREALKAAIRRANQVGHIQRRAKAASDNHELVKAATLAALAVSKRLSPAGQDRLAKALIATVDRIESEERAR
jgi:hypothetical protein